MPRKLIVPGLGDDTTRREDDASNKASTKKVQALDSLKRKGPSAETVTDSSSSKRTFLPGQNIESSRASTKITKPPGSSDKNLSALAPTKTSPSAQAPLAGTTTLATSSATTAPYCGQWSGVSLGDQARDEKFYRLMGAFKTPHDGPSEESRSFAKKALDKKQEADLNSQLEHQWEEAMSTKNQIIRRSGDQASFSRSESAWKPIKFVKKTE